MAFGDVPVLGAVTQESTLYDDLMNDFKERTRVEPGFSVWATEYMSFGKEERRPAIRVLDPKDQMAVRPGLSKGRLDVLIVNARPTVTIAYRP